MLHSPPSEASVSILRDRPALALLGLSVLVRLLASALVGPGFDEAYYAQFPRHLAPGYFDHPPLVALTAGVGPWLTGVLTPVTMRLGAVLWFTLAAAGFYQLAGALYGRRAARIALLLPHATPYFLVGAGAFLIPDNALVALWVWALQVAHGLREGSLPRTVGFLLLGLLGGLALAAKYHAVLLPASLALASLLDREVRHWWRDPRLYMAFAVAVAVFSPVIAWNAANEWISFAEQFGKGGSGGIRFRPDLLGQALGGQLGYLTPWLAVLLWIGALKAPRRTGRGRWLLPFFLLPVVVMTLIGITRTILPHWTMPGYIAAVVLASGWLASRARPFPWLAAAAGANLLLLALVIVHAHTGLVPLKAKVDPTLDPLGWEQTLQWAEEEGHIAPGEPLFAHKWFTAGELDFAAKGERPVVIVGGRPHNYAWWAPEPTFKGASGLLVSQERYRVDIEPDIASRFQRVRELDVPPMEAGGRTVRMVVWRVENLANPRLPPYGPLAREP